MSSKFLAKLQKVSGNEYATIASEKIIGGDITDWIRTGSYSLNALISGSLFSGLPGNKITMLAGEKSTGKSFYAISILKDFQQQFPEGEAIYFETEGAISKEMLAARGIDLNRVGWQPVRTIEDFRTFLAKILNEYESMPEEGRPKLMVILDSLGMLSTEKEVEDIASGSEKKDMTRAAMAKGTFRALTLQMAMLNVPMIMTNHTYDVVGAYIPMKKAGGGSGPEYAASLTIFLSKKKGKIGDDVVGAIITAKLEKSRMTVEGRKIETLLRYDTGIDPYWGLLDLALEFGVAVKEGNSIVFSDGGKASSRKAVEKDPATYYTPAVLKELEKHMAGEFKFGTTNKFLEDIESAPLEKVSQGASSFAELKKNSRKGKKNVELVEGDTDGEESAGAEE